MNIVIFSKDRACQLELFLRSFRAMVSDPEIYDIKILYTYSNNRFRAGYDKLIGIGYPNVEYYKENNFKTDLLSLLDPDKKHTVFFVDDNVFINRVNLCDDNMKVFDYNEAILCNSLRLGNNLTFTYPTQRQQTPPQFHPNGLFYWDKASGDYGYPMSVDGHIFRTKDILPLLQQLNYSNPNTLEGALARQPIQRPLMMCYDNPKIINNPINKVQRVNNNIHGGITAHSLNEQFLEGYIINHTNFMGLCAHSCHKEIPVTLTLQ